jgi:DNA-binding NtrC family response regulator
MTGSWSLLIWDEEGRLRRAAAAPGQVLSICGAPDEGDVHVPALAGRAVYAEVRQDGAHAAVTARIYQPDAPSSLRRAKAIAIKPGVPVAAFGVQWLLVADQSGHAAESAPSDREHRASAGRWSDGYAALIEWAARPMDASSGLAAALNAYLGVVVGVAEARSGLLVLIDERGARLVACSGMQRSEADRFWSKLPKDVIASVVKAHARLLVPAELSTRVRATSTLHLAGVESIAGFPVFADKRVVGLVFVGFGNLLADLTEDLQLWLEHAATVLGLILARRSPAAGKSLPSPLGRNGAGEDRLMIGDSLALDLVYRDLEKLAPTTVPVLIQGETGTGKELAARELHRLSQRARRAFVAVNGAAFPEGMIESELFGHRRGAFTGALADRVGLVEQADGGTLFIDEIAELPLPLQAKLLRALQEKVITRLGESQQRTVDFRLVTASHADFQDLIARRAFREDLFYRIAGARIELPPLRSRREDILLLAREFHRQSVRHYNLVDRDWSHEAMHALRSAPWPGNVRELRNAVERALIIAEGAVITAADLGLIVRQGGEAAATGKLVEPVRAAALGLQRSKEEWLRVQVVEALDACQGNKTAAAKRLGVGRRTLFRYIEQLRLEAGER